MFIGFIAVIIILLVVVALMSTGSNSSAQDAANYMTEAKKIQATASHIRDESQFYYTKNNTFDGISMDYFKTVDFAKGQLVATSNMASADWEGWPSTEVGFPDPYTGPYIKAGGTGGDDIRMVITSINQGKAVGLYILRRKAADLPGGYTRAIEQSMATDSAYIGG